MPFNENLVNSGRGSFRAALFVLVFLVSIFLLFNTKSTWKLDIWECFYRCPSLTYDQVFNGSYPAGLPLREQYLASLRGSLALLWLFVAIQGAVVWLASLNKYLRIGILAIDLALIIFGLFFLIPGGGGGWIDLSPMFNNFGRNFLIAAFGNLLFVIALRWEEIRSFVRILFTLFVAVFAGFPSLFYIYAAKRAFPVMKLQPRTLEVAPCPSKKTCYPITASKGVIESIDWGPQNKVIPADTWTEYGIHLPNGMPPGKEYDYIITLPDGVVVKGKTSLGEVRLEGVPQGEVNFNFPGTTLVPMK